MDILGIISENKGMAVASVFFDSANALMKQIKSSEACYDVIHPFVMCPAVLCVLCVLSAMCYVLCVCPNEFGVELGRVG